MSATALLEREGIQQGLKLPYLDVIEAVDLPIDTLLQKRAESLVGGIAVGMTVEVEPVEESIAGEEQQSNLASSIDKARNGDSEALKMVESNVTTDYLERAYKSGFVSEVELGRTQDGELTQYGQSLESVHINSLRYIRNEKLRSRAKIEALNGIRDQYYSEAGLLRENARLIVSLVHDDMDDLEAEDVGFFTKNRSISIQLLTEIDGKTIIQTAFVAGKEGQNGESFDKKTVVDMVRNLGVDYSGMSSEDIIGNPILINKKVIPGLIDSVAERFDESATAITGKQKFFGRDVDERQPFEAYSRKRAESKKISEKARSDIKSTVKGLLRKQFASPTEATEKLAELNDRLLKENIVNDRTIDSAVLGVKASYYIEHARHLIDIGHLEHRDIFILQRNIELTGRSNSCPGGAESDKKQLDGIAFGENGDSETSEGSTVKDCEFPAKKCPKCDEKNIMVTCKKGKYYGSCGCVSD